MNITRDIINDLLPIYLSEECSQDTRQLVEEYLKSNPDFEKQVKQFNQNPLPNSLPKALGKEDEIKALRKARRLLKLRSYLMGFAIFFTLVPFSFLYIEGKTYWLLREAPYSAILYFILGAGFWIGYLIVKRKGSDL